MFYELAQQYNGSLSEFHPLTEFFSGSKPDVEETIKKDTIRLGKTYLGYKFPAIPATSFMEFNRTGNRVNFEKQYMDRRRILNTLVLSEFLEQKGCFLDDIINGIFAICEESGWQLPAHNSYVRNSENLILPDTARPVIDLFACETGAQLATIYYLLKDSLDSVSPLIGQRILKELKFRILTPYLTQHFWWMGNGEEEMCNWTIWCTQNVLLTTFLSPCATKEERRQVFEKACKSVDYFLKDYGDDGCCNEGAQYYRHAGLCLFNTLEVLNGITDGAFCSCYENEKIRNIALYILNVHIDDKYYANFADCSPVAGRAGVREFLFGKRIHSKELMLFAAQDHTKNPDHILKEELNLFYRLQALGTETEIKNYPKGTLLLHPDIYYKSVGLLLTGDKTFRLAVKAGNNADSHNHNDTGSFILYRNGFPVFVDVGVESYTKKTFSNKRYEIWTMQSAFHNLPTFGEYMQKDGREYCAREVKVLMEEQECSISMELAGCYPKEASVESYRRTIRFKKNTEIVLTDEFASLPKGSFLSLMTYDKPRLNRQKLMLGETRILIDGFTTIEIEEIPITDARLKTAWDHNLYRIKLGLSTGPLSLRIR